MNLRQSSLIVPLFVCLLVNCCAAQQLISVSDAVTIQTKKTVTTNQIIADGVQIASVDVETQPGEPVERAIKLINIDSVAANIRVTIEDSSRNNASEAFAKITNRQYASGRNGTYWFRVLVVDFERNIFDEETAKIVVDGAGPGPEPTPPNPDIDNTYGLGAVAARFAPSDAATRLVVASHYRQAGDFLFGIPTLKYITSETNPDRSVLAWIQQQAGLMQCPDETTCKQWVTFRVEIAKAFKESQQQRQYTRQDWYNAFNEIAKAIQ